MSGYRQDRQLPHANRVARQNEVSSRPGTGPLRPIGNSSAGPARRRGLENPVTVFMREIGLPQYAEALRDNGFDDMETLMGIEEEHMRDIGMAVGHIVKLKRRLQELESAHGNALAPPRALQGKGFAPCGTTMTAVQMSWQQVKNLGTEVVGGLFYKKRASTGKMQRAVWSLSRKFVFKLRPPAAMPESMESFPWAAQRAAPRMVHLKPVVPLCDRELLGWLAQLGVQTLTRISEEEVALEVSNQHTIDGLLQLKGLGLGPFRLQVALDGRWPQIKAEQEAVCESDVEERAETLMNQFLSEGTEAVP
ncbi:unnamed protein product [Effrenium voratum]|nr:unnamed protein product [Effrenium voratum]